jgi:hypothetical protein
MTRQSATKFHGKKVSRSGITAPGTNKDAKPFQTKSVKRGSNQLG